MSNEQDRTAAIVGDGIAVTNVYEAFEAGKRAALAAQQVPPVREDRDLHSHMMIVATRAANAMGDWKGTRALLRVVCKAIAADKKLCAKLAAAPQAPAVPAWQAPAGRLVEWLHCMSYNDSYFGEPAGYLKQCVNELRHLLPPHELKAAAPGAAQPAPQAPLTDEQLLDLIPSSGLRGPIDAVWFGRAIERAHGIAAGVKKPGHE